MTAETVQTARRVLEECAAAEASARAELARSLADAQKAGATIAQLQDWTGYSRRQVFNLLGTVRR